jgi:hypothetical protein
MPVGLDEGQFEGPSVVLSDTIGVEVGSVEGVLEGGALLKVYPMVDGLEILKLSEPSTKVIIFPIWQQTHLWYLYWNLATDCSKLLSFPSPKGLFQLADHNWKANPSHHLFGHSYSAPTPSIATIQHLGLSITKAFAVHFCYSFHRIKDQASHSPPPRVSVPFYCDP